MGIVTTSLDVATHTRFARMAEDRGMTMKSFIARWIAWMDRLDASEAAIVLDQISRDDAPTVAEAVLRRRKKAQREMDRTVERAHQGPGVIGSGGAASATGERVGRHPTKPIAG